MLFDLKIPFPVCTAANIPPHREYCYEEAPATTGRSPHPKTAIAAARHPLPIRRTLPADTVDRRHFHSAFLLCRFLSLHRSCQILYPCCFYSGIPLCPYAVRSKRIYCITVFGKNQEDFFNRCNRCKSGFRRNCQPFFFLILIPYSDRIKTSEDTGRNR